MNPKYAGGFLSGPTFTKGNYAASWGNTFWAQDQMPVSSFGGPPMIDPISGNPPVYRKSAFGFFTIGMNSLTDGSSNTVFLAEVLQGELYDIRGLMWSTIPGGCSFFSRLPPNNPQDYYLTGIVGDYLNNAYFCVSSRARICPAPTTTVRTWIKAPTPAHAAAIPGGINVLLGDGSVRFVKNSDQHAGLAGPQHHQRRRGHQLRCVAMSRLTQYQVPASGLACQAMRVVAIESSGTTYLAAPRRMASRGMPKTTQVASFWAIVRAPASRISSSPPAPSSPMPVMITPAAYGPAAWAAERNRTSTLGRWRQTGGPSTSSTR